MMDWNDSWAHGYGGGGWLMFFGMILVTVAVVLLVVYLVRLTAGAGGGGAQAAAPQQVTLQAASPITAQASADSARELLRRRYAAGEIERAEYLQKLEDLSA
jgi:uncharacterized membrane protein